jgi:SAM-dependent methyltransferase
VPPVALALSRGCGNPTGFADLAAGEVVVDLGCGAGIDVILAAGRVGPTGIVVGIDASPKMIERARQAVADAGYADRDIELKAASIEETGLPSEFADAAVSNCVINLVPDKPAAFSEALRILKRGGRLAVSDILWAEHLEPDLEARLREQWSGCLGGAAVEEDYWDILYEAGFVKVHVVSRHVLAPHELYAIACCPGEEFSESPSIADLAMVQDNIESVKFTAIRPFG